MRSVCPIIKRLLFSSMRGEEGLKHHRLIGLVPVGGAIDFSLLGRVSMCVFTSVYIPTRVTTGESKAFGYIETFT